MAQKNRPYRRLCRFCVVFRFGGREKSPHYAGGLNVVSLGRVFRGVPQVFGFCYVILKI
nr:MAG TPA: hypothetical protein [Caudoviricetes sp.]